MTRALLLTTLLTLAAAAPSAAQIGSSYCLGNACPCGNDDPGAGCGNAGLDGDPSTGSLLSGSGSADVFADDLVLSASGLTPGQFGLILMGSGGPPVPAGDGLVCVSAGPGGLWRFPVQVVDVAGNLNQGHLISASQSFSTTGQIVVGSTWGFQSWYRDAGGPCGTSSNFSSAIDVTFEGPGASTPIRSQLAGRPLGAFPHFEYVSAINEGADAHVAVDPSRFPWLAGATVDLYVVLARGETRWGLDATLSDARGAPQIWTLPGVDVPGNTLLVDAGTLSGTQGTRVGVGYDVVVDVDRDGLLGPGDLIDGLSPEAGYYVVRDTVAPGPYAVTELIHAGGNWLNEKVYHPTNIASLGQQPLIVISHGNGHHYTWYDHIGHHMASYGYVVMSHQNNTGPGIETASETTLTNTDYFLGNLATIAAGVLDGHVDSSRITWIGHSRGGEGVVRAYDRLYDGDYVPTNFQRTDIRLVSSIAPTTFLPKAKVLPHKVPYHLWIGSADSDVTGAPGSGQESYTILERAQSTKMSITLQGVGHGVFHDGGGNWWANGPCLNGPVKTHKMVLGYLLPLVEHIVFGDVPSRDFLWRQWETFQPIGSPPNGNGCIVVNLELHERPEDVFTIDNYETSPKTDKSSSDQPVTFTVTDLEEGRLDDSNSSLTWDPADPFNGMTRGVRPQDDSEGAVFSFDAPSYIEWAVDPAQRNFADDHYLTFRTCQGSRHPLTVAVLEDLTFEVTLRDTSGVTSTIGVGVYGGGVEEPYQRTGTGSGAGWANEFETIRMRLTDFAADGSGLNLALIEAVRFEFGAGHGSTEGRLGLDDLEVVR